MRRRAHEGHASVSRWGRAVEIRSACRRGCGVRLYGDRVRLRVLKQPAGRTYHHGHGHHRPSRPWQRIEFHAGVHAVPPVTGPPACPTSSLQVKQGVAQGYAGGVYEVIDFTNTSGSPCSLYGYPGVSLVSGPPYTQIGLAAKRTASTRPKLVTLAPGATANALLQIVDALNYPNASCGPTKATALKIYPPNQTVPVYLSSTSNGCAKSVQIMYIGPVQPGSGSSS